MKLVKTAEGKTKVRISKDEWERIGNEQGWIKEAKWGKDTDVEQPGKWTNYTIEELKKKRDAAKERNQKRRDQGKKADPKDTELLRELNFAIRAKKEKDKWGEAD